MTVSMLACCAQHFYGGGNMHCLASVYLHLWWCPANNRAAWCCRQKKRLLVSCPVAHYPATPGRRWYVAVCVIAAAAAAAAECLLQLQEFGCSAEHMQGGGGIYELRAKPDSAETDSLNVLETGD